MLQIDHFSHKSMLEKYTADSQALQSAILRRCNFFSVWGAVANTLWEIPQDINLLSVQVIQ